MNLKCGNDAPYLKMKANNKQQRVFQERRFHITALFQLNVLDKAPTIKHKKTYRLYPYLYQK